MKRYLSIILLVLGVAALTGCGTVTPDPVTAAHASYDGDDRNSGIIDSIDVGFVVTSRFRDRYNGLIETYGASWSPALKSDYGVFERTDGKFLITREGMEKFLTMNAWRRMGREAAK